MTAREPDGGGDIAASRTGGWTKCPT